MAIEFVCPACGGTLQVGDENAGRIIRCGGCMTALRVPGGDPATYDAPDPDPYATRGYSPPPPPPPARSAPPAEPPRDEPPAVARPVAPRRRDSDDPYDDRRRTRRRPPPPAGKGVFFWLIVVGAVMLVGVVGCCGGLFLLLPGTKWQDHESKDGGFKVELPGKPQPDVAKATGLRLENGTQAEGTVLLRRAEKFLVIYRDIKPTNKRDTTDEQELDARIEKLRKGLEAERLIRNDPITVNGFPGREVEFRAKTGWHTARVIVADTRVYIVIAGGGAAQPGDGDVRRFLDSFKITDPKLLDEGKRREEQAKLVAEAAQEAKEREAKRKAEEAAEQEASDLHDAAESVAAAALTTARRTRPAPPVAPPPHEPRPPAPLPIDD